MIYHPICCQFRLHHSHFVIGAHTRLVLSLIFFHQYEYSTFYSLVGIFNKVIACDSCIHAFEIVLVDGICGNLCTDYM